MLVMGYANLRLRFILALVNDNRGDKMILTIQQARDLIERCMATYGHDATEQRVIADHLIDCELRGLSFGGLPRALSVIERLRATSTPRRPIKVVKESPVSASIDGGDNVGYLVGLRATELAIAKARQSGIAVVGASKTWYTGMFSYYLEMVTEAGFVGMIAGSGGPKVAPHGGTEARFSTNPIAFGFPAQPSPVIWDVGTAGIMLGEVVLKQRLGEQLAPGQAFDLAGRPTLDPGAALAGAFTVWGGHKGSGLAMVVQMLGMLAGQPAAPVSLQDCGFFILTLDPALLGDAQDYRQRIADYADDLRATRPLDPAHPVRVPFDRSVEQRRKNLERGTIEVQDLVWRTLRGIADTVTA